jgi:hypothetical protein
MAKKKLKIGWQKYEDILEQQMSSPLLDMLMSKAQEYEETEEEEESYETATGDQPGVMIPVSKQLIEEMSMLTNFDCWMGHTNFDITNETKSILNSIEGIEVMRICSRYRFFVGIGKMFDFKSVRHEIEKTLLN